MTDVECLKCGAEFKDEGQDSCPYCGSTALESLDG